MDVPVLELAIAFVIVAMGVALVRQPGRQRAICCGKEDSPRVIISEWVEGYGMWRNRPQNREAPCPRDLVVQMAEYVNNASPHDKWGHPYVFTCTPSFFGLKSLGPDGVDSPTGGDDLRSWEL